MYYCYDCGYEFESPKILKEAHGLSSPPYEERLVCPSCLGSSFNKKSSTHCRCCGARLEAEQYDYCSEECKIRGHRLWQKQLKLGRLKELNPLSAVITELVIYNRENGLNLSYGQFVALKKGKKNAKRKKEIS